MRRLFLFPSRLPTSFPPRPHPKTVVLSPILSTLFSSSSTTSFSSSSCSSSSSFCDVLVLGGGMVGGALACFLGDHPAFRGKKTVVLERGQRTAPVGDAAFSNRVCELSPDSVRFLEGIGVWELIKNQRVKPVSRMQVWDAATDSYIVFEGDTSSSSSSSSSPSSSSPDVVSWTVENDVTVSAIETRLSALVKEGANLEVCHGVRVADISLPGITQTRRTHSPWPCVTLTNGTRIETRLIVGADGSNSAARQAAAIRTWDYDYGQLGVVATLQLEQAFGNTVAWQRFLSTGPIAILPLDEYHSSLVWSVGVEEAKRLLAMAEEEFVKEVHHAIWGTDAGGGNGAGAAAVKQMAGKYGDLLPTTSGRQLPPKISGLSSGSRAAFPLKMSHAADYVKPGLALVGDAAHRIHPMAGQGVNLGFGDAAKLGEILVDGAKRGADLGNPSLLQPYETSRQRKVVPLIAGLQALHHLYGSTWSPIVALRSFGLQSVDALPVLKNAFANYAMTH